MAEPVLKVDLKGRLEAPGPIRIELGCGKAKDEGFIGIDRVDIPGVDIVADLNKGLPFFPDNSVDEVHSHSVLEHVENFEYLMAEIVRVLKPEGRCFSFVPHFSNPYYYSDPTHVRFFGLYTFYYFVDKSKQLRRKVPSHYWDTRIEVLRIKMKFTHPFRLVRMARKLFGSIINRNTWLQEWYEASMTAIIPCDGMLITFKPQKTMPNSD